MIEVKNLFKKYGKQLAVNDVSFTVNDGEVLGFLGLNGAGKSTIMNIMTGYLSASYGTVTIDGYDILTSANEAKKHIGYLPEIPPLYPDMTVKEYLYFMFDLKKVKLPKAPHIEEICSLIKIDNVYNRLIKNLSKGYRQRVGIAQCLLGNPDVIILDEPTVGLDPKQIIEIRNLIHHLGHNHTVIISSHILSEIQSVCDRILVINNGMVEADGKPSELSSIIMGDNPITVRIKGDNANVKSDVTRLIKNIIGVKDIIFLGSFEDGTYDYSISCAKDTDLREGILTSLILAGFSVLSFKETEFNLEQIFLNITENDGIAEDEAIEETESED